MISTRLTALMTVFVGVGFFIYGGGGGYQTRAQVTEPEIRVVVPIPVQLLFGWGDKHLAASLMAIRALVTETQKMTKNEFIALAKIQRDVSRLNPAHEDNYYTAAAILPWNGELGSANFILQRATTFRVFDLWPPFYLGFHAWHLEGDPIRGASWLLLARDRARSEHERIAMESIAARWSSKGKNNNEVIWFLDLLAKSTRHPVLKHQLEQQSDRLRAVEMLNNAVKEYSSRYGKPPSRLEDLIAANLTPALPALPSDMRFDLQDGVVILR